jgi:hypothetical protein
MAIWDPLTFAGLAAVIAVVSYLLLLWMTSGHHSD